MSPNERYAELKRNKLCFQCLTPGLKAYHEGKCFDIFKCPYEDHKRFKNSPHILICDQHKNKANLYLLEQYKLKCIMNSKDLHRDFSKNIGISFHVEGPHIEMNNNGSYKTDNEIEQCEETVAPIFMLQTIRVGNKNLNLFFDSGCGYTVCKKGAVDWLVEHERAKNIVRGPLVLFGVGDQNSVCEYGKYQVPIPLHNGKNVNFAGVCLDKITNTFPSYPLKKVENDIRQSFIASGGIQKCYQNL